MKSSLALLLPLLAGCAGSGYMIPKSHIDSAYQAVGAAQQRVTGPSDRLDRAKSELSEADRLLRHGNARKADLMYLNADADARIASAQAIQASAAADAQRLHGQVQEVQGQTAGLCGPGAAQAP
jgi:hypothetical protein